MELLNDRDASVFEEHLLLCEACRARVADATQYVCAMKKAAAELRSGVN
jgi:anti-sigma factor RsiW